MMAPIVAIPPTVNQGFGVEKSQSRETGDHGQDGSDNESGASPHL